MTAFLPRAILFAILAMVVVMILCIAYAALQMAVIAPGLPLEDYVSPMQDFFIVVSVPAVFAAGWLAARTAPANAAVGVAAIVAVTCIAIEIGAQMATTGLAVAPWGSIALSAGTKLAAAIAGGWLASRSHPLASDDDITT